MGAEEISWLRGSTTGYITDMYVHVYLCGAVLTHDEMLSFPCHTHVHCISRGISMPACISNSSY